METDNPIEGASPQPEGRSRHPTEKGLEYNIDLKRKNIQRIFKELSVKSDELHTLTSNDASVEEVKEKYKNWQTNYALFLKTSDDLTSMMSPEDRDFFVSSDYRGKDLFLKNVKASIENWFSLRQPPLPTVPGGNLSEIVCAEDSVSQAGRSTLRPRGTSRVGNGSGVSLASSVSAARFAEEQRKAELQQRAIAVRRKSELDLAKMKLQIEQDELEIQTKLAISAAKMKVIDKFDNIKQEPVNDNVNDTMYPKSMVNTYNDSKYALNNHPPPISHFHNASPTVTRDPNATNVNAHGLSPFVSPFVPNANLSPNNAQTVMPNASDVNVSSQCSQFPGCLPTVPRQTSEDMLMSVVRHLSKPAPDLKKFDGHPLEYKKFLRQFYSKVVSNTDSNNDRMAYLEQFTVGEPNRIVSGYSYLDADQGYPAALQELERRYGNNDVLAAAFVKRALDWPVVKPDNPKALDDFGIFLAECGHAVQNITALKVLEYPDNMKKLIGKLPYYYHDKWRNIVERNRENGRSVTFSQLVEFVLHEARKATDPVYGKSALRPEQHDTRRDKPKVITKKVKGTFATNVSDSETGTSKAFNKAYNHQPTTNEIKGPAFEAPCLYCTKQSHSLDNCEKIFYLPYQERIDFLKKKGCCYGCLIIGHPRKDCRNKAICKHCDGRHPSICHVDGKPPYPETQPKRYVKRDDRTTTTASVNSYNEMIQSGSNDTECTMAIIPVSVKMKNGMKVVQTYAFIDPGSTATFCTGKLLTELGGSGKPRQITLDTMGERQTLKTLVVSGLEVGDLNLNNIIELPKVYTKDKMPVSSNQIPTSTDVAHWSHLQDIKTPELDADIGLMIGNNVPDAFSPIEIRTGKRGSPHATKSLLGWILWSVTRPVEGANIATVNRTAIIQEIESLQQLDRKIQDAIQLDFPEHIIDDRKEPSQEDRKFKSKVDNSIKFENGQYCINLPFKSENFQFPNNEIQARQRLKGLRTKMTSNPIYKKDYTEFMDTILQKGYAELVPPEELHREDGRVWYIPHHGVYHPRKPQKIRVVFDCSATYEGACLNTALLQGPDLTNNLLAVLLRFRQEKVAVMGDIESMFYRVNVPKDDSDCLRFLWWPNGNTNLPPLTYRMRVHLFGAISSPSCANVALRKTVEDNQHKFKPDVADAVNRNFYVDDCLSSKESETKAIELVENVTAICQLGGFRVRKWVSSSRKVIESIPLDYRAKEVQNLNLECEDLPIEHVLGVHWDTENDCLGFNIQPRDLPCTRRGILSMVSAVFDPLGLAAPFTLIGKLVLQDLCRNHIGWDEPLPEESLKTWQKWLEELPLLKNVKINRCYKPSYLGPIATYQLHIFSDASEKGYGVAIYLRLVDVEGNIHVTLVLGKARVAPLKKVSIPRMELTAATIAVRLSRMVSRELDYNIDTIHYWTDSMAVLRYVKNETTRFHTFVANRITVIRDGSDIQQWRYVPSKLNAADAASRGCHLDKFLQNEAWIGGPQFLSQPEEKWPHLDNNVSDLQEDDPEVKTTVNAAVIHTSTNFIDTLIERCSSWFKLKSILGWVLTAVERFKSALENRSTKSRTLPNAKDTKRRVASASLNFSKLQEAEVVLVKHVQEQNFSKEIAILGCQDPKAMKNLPKSSPIRKLIPFLSNGLLRVGGRLDRADIPYSARHPVILPRARIAHLYLDHIHKTVGHLGKNTMLNTVRQRYWILGAPTLIKGLLRRCVSCRRYQAKAGEQIMANLPKDRLQPNQPPFSSVGVDYFGPIEIRRGRSILKRYGVVFTCLTSRAVHLEVASSLDTDSCICAIRRLIARRGPIEMVRSDNGTNLVGSEKELKAQIEQWNQAKINKTLQQHSIRWIFNPPAASHHGGVWERIIRIVRKILYSLLRQQSRHLDDELLATLFCEVESVLNNRPITEIAHDYRDLDALTPNHLLLFRSGEQLPPGVFNKNDNYANRRWRQVQYLSDVFWRRWTLEYLPLLQERQKWLRPKRNLEKNDLVLIVDSTPRNSWCLGRILDTTKDRHGIVRSVTLKTKTTTLVRPVDKLCLILEADNE